MNHYFVAQITIDDPDEYQTYLDGFDKIFAQYQGTVIAADDQPTVLEGKWTRTRIVIIRFPSEAELNRWYHSPEYQVLARHRRKASRADILCVRGRETN